MSEQPATATGQAQGDRVTCTVSIHPCGADAVTVDTRQFTSAADATAALQAALDAGTAFTVAVHQPDEPARTRTIVVHPRNTALIQVQASDETTTGQYL